MLDKVSVLLFIICFQEKLSTVTQHFIAVVKMGSEKDSDDVQCVASELGHTLHLVGIMTSWRQGSRVRDTFTLFQVCILGLGSPFHLMDLL